MSELCTVQVRFEKNFLLSSILTQTEQVETVMTLMEVEPNLPQCQEVTLLQCGTLMVLWFFVLLAQFLLFWQSKKRG